MTRFQKTFCWLVLLTGFGLFALGVRSARYRYHILQQWPITVAEATSSRVVYASQDRKPRSLAEYQFRYRVEGAPYTASTSVVRSDYRDAQELVSRTPAGSTKRIRYNPANPAEMEANAVYNLEFFKLPLIFFGVGFSCVFVGSLPLLLAARRPKRDQVTSPNCQRLIALHRPHSPSYNPNLYRHTINS